MWWGQHRVSFARGVSVLQSIASFGYHVFALRFVGAGHYQCLAGRNASIAGFSDSVWNITDRIANWAHEATVGGVKTRPPLNPNDPPQANLWFLHNDGVSKIRS